MIPCTTDVHYTTMLPCTTDVHYTNMLPCTTFAGVTVGMGMVGLDDIVSTGCDLADRGYRRVNPFFVPRILVNMAAGNISLRYSLKVQETSTAQSFP